MRTGFLCNAFSQMCEIYSCFQVEFNYKSMVKPLLIDWCHLVDALNIFFFQRVMFTSAMRASKRTHKQLTSSGKYPVINHKGHNICFFARGQCYYSLLLLCRVTPAPVWSKLASGDLCPSFRHEVHLSSWTRDCTSTGFTIAWKPTGCSLSLPSG